MNFNNNSVNCLAIFVVMGVLMMFVLPKTEFMVPRIERQRLNRLRRENAAPKARAAAKARAVAKAKAANMGAIAKNMQAMSKTGGN